MIIVTQAADEVCQRPSIFWFYCDDLGVIVLRFYLVTTPNQYSCRIVLCTGLVDKKIPILLLIEKVLLVLFYWTILISNLIFRSKMITTQPITEI